MLNIDNNGSLLRELLNAFTCPNFQMITVFENSIEYLLGLTLCFCQFQESSVKLNCISERFYLITFHAVLFSIFGSKQTSLRRSTARLKQARI